MHSKIILTTVTGVIGSLGCTALLLQDNFLLKVYAVLSAALMILVTVGGAIEIQRKYRREKTVSKDIASRASCMQ
jgi:hypothetical protein